MDRISDDMLLQAIRQRILDQIEARQQMAPIINNVYGSGPSGGMQGVADLMNKPGDQPEAEEVGPDPYEYRVDIQRRNVYDPDDPEKMIGWNKSVNRYRELMGNL